MTRAIDRLILGAMLLCLTAVVSVAQTTTSTTQTKSFEVLALNGNTLVVRLPEGTRELTVPDDFRFTVNGQQMSVHQLTVGMRGTATVTTRTTVTPVSVTEVKNGTVLQSGGPSIIVRTDDGVKMFTQGDVDKRGVQIMREGKPARVSDFRTGDRLSAVIITSQPPKVMTEQEVQATTLPAAAAAPRAAAAPAIAPPAGAPAARTPPAPAVQQQASAAAPARTLPKTASSWPLLGLASALSLALGIALMIGRRLVP